MGKLTILTGPFSIAMLNVTHFILVHFIQEFLGIFCFFSAASAEASHNAATTIRKKPGRSRLAEGRTRVSRVFNQQTHGGFPKSWDPTSKIGAFYPLVNKQLDPENHQFLMETSLPTPMTARVYVNLPEGKVFFCIETMLLGCQNFKKHPYGYGIVAYLGYIIYHA